MFVTSLIGHVAGHAAVAHPVGEVGCELRPRMHHMFRNVISTKTELTQPLQTGKI